MSKKNLAVKQSLNEFGFQLFKVFIIRHKNEYKNLCFSSAAVFNSLVMILIGSRNKSESQLAAVLHLLEFNVDRKKLEELMHLRDVIMKANHDIILTSTHLYVDKSIALKEEYKQILRQCFQIKPKSVDFSQVEETVRIMNKDAMDSTDSVTDEVIQRIQTQSIQNTIRSLNRDNSQSVRALRNNTTRTIQELNRTNGWRVQYERNSIRETHRRNRIEIQNIRNQIRE
jgi:serine protease inhibitor